MTRVATAIGLICWACLARSSNGQESAASKDYSSIVAFTGLPGGLLYQNAFWANRSTRFILLKVIAANPHWRKQFELTESQVTAISQLKQLDTGEIRNDPNDPPDEPRYVREYYSFLTDQQRDRLIALAIHFDGLAALSHKSISERIGLEPARLNEIQKVVKEKKEKIFLPVFHSRFGGSKTDQDKWKAFEMDIRLVIMVNFEILSLLSDGEKEKLCAFLGKHLHRDLLEAIQATMELPSGLESIIPAEELKAAR